MELFLWIEVKNQPVQVVRKGQRTMVKDWEPEYDRNDIEQVSIEGRYHYVKFSEVAQGKAQEEINERGFTYIESPIEVRCQNTRGIEWEDYPSYGGWNPSEDEPQQKGDRRESVSYRAGSHHII